MKDKQYRIVQEGNGFYVEWRVRGEDFWHYLMGSLCRSLDEAMVKLQKYKDALPPVHKVVYEEL